jgi:ATP-dependent helicase/nuclease subunit B
MKGSGAELKSMSLGTEQGVVLKCPNHAPFLPALAASILSGSIWGERAPEPHELPQLTIYLPALAAVEPLKLAFLALAPSGATFLPRIRVLGDADPLELFASYGTRMASASAALKLLEHALAIPPAFGQLERQVQLTSIVVQASQSLQGLRLAPGEPLSTAMPAASAFTVAGQIADLIGEGFTEGADLSRIALLDSTYASGSEQLSLQLLRAVLRGWQMHKVKAGKLDREERRNRLMAIEAQFVQQSKTPVIIAGSSGSIAATTQLMEAALGRPKAALVLYGLDDAQTAASFAAMGAHPEHPQHGLQQLLTRLNVRLEDIRALPALSEKQEASPPHPGLLPRGRRHARNIVEKSSGLLSPLGERDRVRGDFEPRLRRVKFLSEALRPAPATAEWAHFIKSAMGKADNPAPGLSLIEATTVQAEAAAIALILRESLETPEQTAALVTPSKSLLARVLHALAKWGLAAGSPAGRWENSLAARAVCCAANGTCDQFVELLRYAQEPAGRIAEIIDLGVLRQMWRPSSFLGVTAALSRAEHAVAAGEARHPAMKRIAATEWEGARELAAALIEALSPLTVCAEKQLALPDWIAAHGAALARLAQIGLSVTAPGGGEMIVLGSLEEAAAPSLSLDLSGYASLFEQAVLTKREPAQESPHPRIFLRNPLDARLLTADVIVLGGLNEGCWPQGPDPDPWLNRRDRAFVGLPPQERRIGQAAHDFEVLAASARRVILTRAKKENGSLTRPSRWVSRIKALAAGAGRLDALEPDRPWLTWAAAHRLSGAAAPIGSPAPKPPLAARPRRLSVTAIETWFANPYAIYARHILGLEPLCRLDETSDARDRGILYHAALNGFFQAYPGALPENAASVLSQELDKAAQELGFNLQNAPFWRPRFARFAAWFAETEGERRKGVQVLKSEAGGKLSVEAPGGRFEITARADRIDQLAGGSLRIYDFKTSANTAKISAGRGAPQLALEGLLARAGAFAGIPAGLPAELFYIVATGGEPPGEIVGLKLKSAEVIEAAYRGTLARIARFDDEATSYGYETRAIFRDKNEHDPYAHLARVREWAAGAGDAETGDD